MALIPVPFLCVANGCWPKLNSALHTNGQSDYETLRRGPSLSVYARACAGSSLSSRRVFSAVDTPGPDTVGKRWESKPDASNPLRLLLDGVLYHPTLYYTCVFDYSQYETRLG